MNRLSILVAAGLLAGAGMVFPAHTHSWYPRECCSDGDCMPADGIERDARGDMQVIVGRRRIWVPDGFAVRPSADHQIHICFHVDDYKFLMPLCLFMPAQS
jgi:hypothetical protein